MIKIILKGDLLKEFDAKVAKQKSEKIEKLVVALKEATPVDTGYAQSRWRREGNTIVNDAEYMTQLNGGSSQQAPSYFIEKTLLTQQGVNPSGTIVRPK